METELGIICSHVVLPQHNVTAMDSMEPCKAGLMRAGGLCVFRDNRISCAILNICSQSVRLGMAVHWSFFFFFLAVQRRNLVVIIASVTLNQPLHLPKCCDVPGSVQSARVTQFRKHHLTFVKFGIYRYSRTPLQRALFQRNFRYNEKFTTPRQQSIGVNA